MATTIRSRQERELHLIDVENLLGTPYYTAAAVCALRTTYDRVSETGSAAQQVIGTSASSNLLTAALAWGGARPVFENGADGADRALLAAGEYAPEQRFGRIVIGSGDHVFATYAADLQRKGVEVTVVCRPESLSRVLRLAVHDVRYLRPIDSGPNRTDHASRPRAGRLMAAKRGRPASMPDLRAPDIIPVPVELLDAGACGGRNDIFDDEDQTATAKLLCAACPVRKRCLDYALVHEEFGIWGGATPEERDELRGHPFAWTWEQRVEAQRLRTLFSRGVPEEKIAAEYAVSTRSVQRKKVEYHALKTAA